MFFWLLYVSELFMLKVRAEALQKSLYSKTILGYNDAIQSNSHVNTWRKLIEWEVSWYQRSSDRFPTLLISEKLIYSSLTFEVFIFEKVPFFISVKYILLNIKILESRKENVKLYKVSEKNPADCKNVILLSLELSFYSPR